MTAARQLYGTDEPLPDTLELQAGPLRCTLEAGQVRGLWWHGTEVLRGVAYLLRDRQWGTAPARIEGLQFQRRQEPTGAGFEVRFTLRLPLEGATLTARAQVEGRDDGHFSFRVEAQADHPLVTARCGLVLLHPADCAGLALNVEHTTGLAEATCFPELISPGQPVFDIRSLAWAPAPGLAARCRLQAELPDPLAGRFEMEDQRNWSDASFKTYVGSLLDPWPYELPAGLRFSQAVELQIEGQPMAAPGRPARGGAPAPAQATWHPVAARSMPPLGVGMPHLGQPPNAAERAAVAALRPGWLVVQADLGRADLAAHLDQARWMAQASGAALQLDLLCSDTLPPAESARQAAAQCRSAGLVPQAVRLCPRAYLKSYQPTDSWPDVPPLEAFAQAARGAFPGARVGGGMLTYFTELNRCRQSGEHIDFIGHSTCPIVHAADDVSVMQTLQALPHIARTIRHHWPGQSWRVGPVALSAARNPYGQSPVPNPLGLRLALADRDPRHQAQFGAAWFAGYVATLAPWGPELLALMDSHGPAGPLAEGAGSLPASVSASMATSEPATVPAWAVLAELSAWSGLPLWQARGLPPGMLGLAVSGPDGRPTRAMLVNTTPQPLQAELAEPMAAGPGAGHPDTAVHQVALPPFGVAWLRGRVT